PSHARPAMQRPATRQPIERVESQVRKCVLAKDVHPVNVTPALVVLGKDGDADRTEPPAHRSQGSTLSRRQSLAALAHPGQLARAAETGLAGLECGAFHSISFKISSTLRAMM